MGLRGEAIRNMTGRDYSRRHRTCAEQEQKNVELLADDEPDFQL
jgi:hypothetical protein